MVMRNIVKIDEDKYSVRIGYAKLGKEILPVLKQRIDFILNRPSPYIDNPKYDEEHQKYFVAFKADLVEFRKAVVKFEEEFVNAIDQAHKQQRALYAK